MNNTKKSLKVLFIGESWHIHMIHSKGYDSFTSSKYEEGATWLLQCLKNSQVDVTYMPAHTVQIAFPEDVGKRAARTVLTGMCYSVGSATRQGSSSPTRFIGQSAMTSRT